MRPIDASDDARYTRSQFEGISKALQTGTTAGKVNEVSQFLGDRQ
jgi:hypothetical protein